MRKRIPWVASLSLLLSGSFIFHTCKKDDPPPVHTTLELRENTRAIDTTALDLLEDPARLANGDYTYKLLGAAPGFKVGDVLVGPEGEGYLRRITGIQPGAGEITYRTEQATLEDLFKKGDLEFSLNFSGLKPRGDGFDFTIQNQSFQHGPLNLTLNGAFNFNADWVFDFQFENSGIRAAEISVQNGTFTGNCTATLSAGQAVNLKDQTSTLANYTASKWVTIPGIPIPVYAVLNVDLVLHYSASVSANMTVQARYQTNGNVQAGIRYDGTQWHNTFQFTPGQTLDIVSPTGSAAANAQFSIGPVVSVKLYGVAGPYLRLTLEEALLANVASPKLDWDFSADAWIKTVLGVDVKALGNTLIDYQKEWNSPKLNLTMPHRLQRVSGDNQVGPVNQPLPNPVRVRVLDSNGQPQTGVPVYFDVASGGGGVSPGSIISDAQGYAEAQWSLGPNAGVFQTLKVSVRKADGQHVQDSPLEFTASGAAGPCACNANSQLCIEAPTETLIRQALAGFVFDAGPGTLAEAKRLLEYLCANVQHVYTYSDGTARACGVLPTGQEITLWTPTYGNYDRYGVRYGPVSANHSYFGSNATYFELVK